MTKAGSLSVSCVVPVWNGAAFLAQALDSILVQTHPVDEVIVVDDGSTDGSAAVAERYGGRVRVVRQPHRGTAAARNQGIAQASGDWIALLDADDLWGETKLARQFEAIAARPGVGCCFTLLSTFAEPGSGAVIPPGLRTDRVGRCASTFLGARWAVDRVGPMDEAVPTRAEFAWFARLADLGIESVLVPERLVHRRLHDANSSLRQSGEALDAAFDLVLRRLAHAVARG